MFKEMRIVFVAKKDPAYEAGQISFNREGFCWEVKRQLSGATAYGDRSEHSVIVIGHPEFGGKYYDTRYDGIPTQKDKWIQFWKNQIEDRVGGIELEPDMETYEEREEED